MNKTKTMLTVISVCFALAAGAQGDYRVTTASPKSEAAAEDETQFVVQNFPYYTICGLQAGQKFMLVAENSYGIVSTLKSSATGRDVSNSKLQYKILAFSKTEEVKRETYIGESTSTHFIFEAEGETYYHEVKNKALADICASNSRAAISNLVFLGDVDIARELLTGKTLYTKVATAQIDDATAMGSREVNIARNLEVTVTAVGVGTRDCPVKIVFEDRNGNAYFRNVMFSKTNAGLQNSDLTGANSEKFFPNVFAFVDKEAKTAEDVRAKYIGRAAYPKQTVGVQQVGEGMQTLLRYTSLVIKDLIPSMPGTMATLKLADRQGNEYTVEVDLKYNIIIRNDNYMDDMFGYGDLRKQYPAISEENWLLLGKGEIKNGMTKDECMLSLGSPIQRVAQAHLNRETWYYQGRTIEFENGRIARIM